MWLQTAVSFGKWAFGFEVRIEMDVDMCKLIQFVTYIGVWQRVRFFPPFLFSLSPYSKNIGRVFHRAQLESLCDYLIDLLWETPPSSSSGHGIMVQDKNVKGFILPSNVRFLSHAIDCFQMVNWKGLMFYRAPLEGSSVKRGSACIGAVPWICPCLQPCGMSDALTCI